MVYITKLKFYDNCNFIISNILVLYLIVKLFYKNIVFDYQLSKKSNKSKFINLNFYKKKSIVGKISHNLY